MTKLPIFTPQDVINITGEWNRKQCQLRIHRQATIQDLIEHYCRVNHIDLHTSRDDGDHLFPPQVD